MSTPPSEYPGSTALIRRNRAPIALLGGFTVWGREEAFGFRYWGGPGRDIQEDLENRGFETATVAVGPFASNWDRACEAYAILKGGRVDYGEAHSARHGHARFGRTYPGLLPDWGEPGRGLHIVAHSQGGQTARVLAQLLLQGDTAERLTTPNEELSPLFLGDHDWILSITTLATPHNGTSLALKHQGLVGPVQKFLALMTSLTSRGPRPVYDFKLDPWGIQRGPSESVSEHAKKVFECSLWQETKDFCAWDLCPDGAREFNAWVKTQPRIYHFSWSTAKTRPDARGHQVPSRHMTPFWIQGSRFMGRTTRIEEGKVPIDDAWFRNDGVVNTCSMAGPSTEVVHPFDGNPRRGIWNHMGVLEGWDHSEILGIGPEHGDEVMDFHRRWAAFLGSLEP